MKKRIGLLLTLSLVIGLAGCAEQKQEPETVEKTVRTVQTTAVSTGNISSDFSYSGKVAPSREVSVVPTIPGKVVSYGFDVGDHVSEGAVLFQVDSTDLQNNLRSIEANYNATKLQMDNAKNTLDNNMVLLEEGIVSQSEIDQMKLAYDSAQASLTAIQIQKENLEKNIADCTVKSPINGVVSVRGVEIGSFASQGAPAYTLIDLSAVKVEVGVSEQMVNEIAEGQKVDVLLTAVSPEPLQGTVSTINPTASQTGTYTVKVTMNNGKKLLRPGMLAEVRFITAASSGAMLLPRNAVLEKDDEVYVYTVENNVAKKVLVETGIESGEMIEITKGLTEGMQVVTKGQTYISDGETVKVSQPEQDITVPIDVNAQTVPSEEE